VISSGVVEGFSGKAKLTARKAYGLRTPQGIEIAMFHPMRNPARAENIPQILLRRLFQRAVSATGKSAPKLQKPRLDSPRRLVLAELSSLDSVIAVRHAINVPRDPFRRRGEIQVAATVSTT